MPIDKPTPNRKPPLFQHAGSDKPTRAEAEDAIRTLLRGRVRTLLATV